MLHPATGVLASLPCPSPSGDPRFRVRSCSFSAARVVAASWTLHSSASIRLKLLLSSWISVSLRHISRRRTTVPSSTSFVISATAAFANTSMMAATCVPKEEGKDILPRWSKDSAEPQKTVMEHLELQRGRLLFYFGLLPGYSDSGYDVG